MVKMEVVFKNGIAFSDLVPLHNLIKKYGGEWVSVPLKNVEAQNTSDNTQSHAISLCLGCIKEPCSQRSEIPSCPVNICSMRQAKHAGV